VHERFIEGIDTSGKEAIKVEKIRIGGRSQRERIEREKMDEEELAQTEAAREKAREQADHERRLREAAASLGL
jgi:hypothetical protein